ncbi:hypothetical protein QTP70_017106, partial [Hemibagrus guttatus]
DERSGSRHGASRGASPRANHHCRGRASSTHFRIRRDLSFASRDRQSRGPPPFSGSAEDCNGFLLQCSLALEMQPHLYPDDRAKVAFIISRLDGKALRWAKPLWTQNHPAMISLSSFLEHFREVLGTPAGDSSIGERLCRLKQGAMTVTDYALQFRTLAAASGWNEQALITIYRQGLDPRIRLHLAAYKDSIGLEKFIQLSIRFATRMQLCLEKHQAQPLFPATLRRPEPVSRPEPAGKPMDLEHSDLAATERQREWQRRLTQNQCLYYGRLGHYIAECPQSSGAINARALLDSGSAGNFIYGTLCHQLCLKITATLKVYQVHAVTGKPLRMVRHLESPLHLQVGALHTEEIYLLVLEDSTADIVLGRPWLEQHDPKGRIYSLSIPEEKAVEEYIQEGLSQGYIRPSTFHAASSFFFVAKKDGSLRPCIDYRALNKIMVKFRYPLHLVPSALERWSSATVFTKLDLRSAYNLIQIREGG